jgi:serine/threonine protein phosphatase PrpC
LFFRFLLIPKVCIIFAQIIFFISKISNFKELIMSIDRSRPIFPQPVIDHFFALSYARLSLKQEINEQGESAGIQDTTGLNNVRKILEAMAKDIVNVESPLQHLTCIKVQKKFLKELIRGEENSAAKNNPHLIDLHGKIKKVMQQQLRKLPLNQCPSEKIKELARKYIDALEKTYTSLVKQESMDSDSKGFCQTLSSLLIAMVEDFSQAKDLKGHFDLMKNQLCELSVYHGFDIPEQIQKDWLELTRTIQDLFEEGGQKLGLFDRTSEKDKSTPEERMARYKREAIEAMQFLEEPKEEIEGYPKTEDDKKAIFKKIDLVEKLSEFESRNVNQMQIVFPELKDSSFSCITVATAIGQRDYMEDRFKVREFKLMVNGKQQEVEVLCVFDGHGGSDAVHYAETNFIADLKSAMNKRFENKEINNDDIFYGLKEAIQLTHKNILETRTHSGTTAVVAFKLKNSKRLFVANIGDSRAFLIRNGSEVTPLTVEHKPYLIKTEQGTKPNKYANQLIKRGVRIAENTDRELRQLDKHMVMSIVGVHSNRYDLRLGITDVTHLDMTRSIGDKQWAELTIHSPEILYVDTESGDQVFMYTDGIPFGMNAMAKVIEEDQKNEIGQDLTAMSLVHTALPYGDNTTLIIATMK